MIIFWPRYLEFWIEKLFTMPVVLPTPNYVIVKTKLIYIIFSIIF